jgi:MFS family permease
LSTWRLLFGISIFWLALSVLFDGINGVLLPTRLLQLGNGDASATVLGFTTFVGLLAAALIQPIAGAFSDRRRGRWRRRPGVILGAAFALIGLLGFGGSSSLILLLAAYLLVQVAASVAQASQQGFIPDVVPAHQRGFASGWKSFMDFGGSLIGFAVIGVFLGSGDTEGAVVAVGVIVITACVLTLVLAVEPEAEARPETDRPSAAATVINAFRVDPQAHRSFLWLVASRFLFLLATYAIGRFLLFFVADRLGLGAEEAAARTSGLLVGLLLVTILAAPLAGWVADRLGRVPVMVAGSMLSAAGAVFLMGATNEAQIFGFGSAMSVGSATFAGASWALMADLVPRTEAARFFGLANLGNAGAAAGAGLFGPLIDASEHMAPGMGYPGLFAAAAVLFVASGFVAVRAGAPQTKEVRLESETG